MNQSAGLRQVVPATSQPEQQESLVRKSISSIFSTIATTLIPAYRRAVETRQLEAMKQEAQPACDKVMEILASALQSLEEKLTSYAQGDVTHYPTDLNVDRQVGDARISFGMQPTSFCNVTVLTGNVVLATMLKERLAKWSAVSDCYMTSPEVHTPEGEYFVAATFYETHAMSAAAISRLTAK